MTQPEQTIDGNRAIFAPISTDSALDEIAKQIRQEIKNNRLKPGQKLPPERDLCEHFGVSRNTLREALRALQVSGIIEIRKVASGGTFIKQGDKNVVITGLRDLYDLGSITAEQLTEARIMLSDPVIRDVCVKATDADLADLEENVALAEAAHKAGNHDERARLHLQFHRQLVRISGNPILIMTMEAILQVLSEFVAQIGYGEHKYVIPSRRRLLSFLTERNVDAAAAEMTAHLHRVHQHYLSLRKSSN